MITRSMRIQYLFQLFLIQAPRGKKTYFQANKKKNPVISSQRVFFWGLVSQCRLINSTYRFPGVFSISATKSNANNINSAFIFVTSIEHTSQNWKVPPGIFLNMLRKISKTQVEESKSMLGTLINFVTVEA
jgi:hypothetical protein